MSDQSSDNDGNARNGVQSAEVALRVLVALAEAGGEASLSALAAAARMPAAKAHRYVVSLVHSGFLVRGSHFGSYALGPTAMQVGLVALGRMDMMESATAALYELRNRVDETALLAVWSVAGPTVVRLLESAHTVTLNVRVGSKMPLSRSATGLVFGAFLEKKLIGRALKQELAEAHRQGTDTASEAELHSRFAQVRRQGHSFVDGELIVGIRAVSAPVFDANGELVAALTVLGVGRNFMGAERGKLAKTVVAAGNQLSTRLGANIR